MKLRYSVKTIAGALSTIDPDMFYKDKNGAMFREKSNKPVIEKIKKRCENGFIGILVAYPADVHQESFVTNGPNGRYELRESQEDKLIGIIDQKNASTVFHNDHLRFLDVLKDTMKRKKKDEEEKTGEGSKSKKKQKRAKK